MKQNAEPDCVIMLVGNKVDVDIEKREVSTEEGRILAEENRLMFSETSARENVNVNDSFEELIKGTIFFN